MTDANGLPGAWVSTTLGAIRLDRSTSINPSKRKSETFELYSIPAYPSGRPEIVTGTEIGSTKKSLEPGTVILSKINPRINRVWVVGRRNAHQQIGSSEWIPFFPRAGLNPKYLAYFMQQGAFRNYLAANVSGVGGSLMRVKPSTVDPYPFVLPPGAEQHRIVEAIESYFTRLDDAVATLEWVKRNLKRYRASVLKAAVEGRLVPTEAELARTEGRDYEPASVLLDRILAERRRGWEEAELAKMNAKGKPPKDDKWKERYEEQPVLDRQALRDLPEGWARAPLPSLHADGGFVRDGDWVESKDQDSAGGIRLTQLQDIGDGVFRDRSRRFMNEEQVARLRCTLLERGDVLVARMPDPLGRACVFAGLPTPSVTAVDICIIRLKDGACDPGWLAHCLNSPPVRLTISRLQSGSTRKRISRANLCTIPLPLPPLLEQFRIRQELDRVLSLIEDLELSVVAQVQRCARLRQAVLNWAFSGLLVDQDPADEPASRLLERIRVERESTNGVASRGSRRRRARST